MSMKERFHLFLEKGFCPELEEGVDDPMYKYFGGQIKDPSLNGECNATKQLCTRSRLYTWHACENIENTCP